MAYNTVTSQQREKQFRDLNRITKDYGDCASEATDALNAFRKALDGMHDAANRLRCGFSIEGTPTEDEVRRIVGLEVGRVLNTSFTLFSFADFHCDGTHCAGGESLRSLRTRQRRSPH